MPSSDAKQVGRAVGELSAARKTILMYPAGHSQVQHSIDRAHKSWGEILDLHAEYTIGTDKDGLFVGRDASKLKDSTSKEFSSVLRDHDLAVVHFRRGLSSKELAALLQAIARDPEKVGADGGVERALAKEDVRHIRVQCVDYGKFLHTEEEEIEKRGRGKNEGEEDSIWGHFVTHLILGTLTDSEKGISLQSAEDYAPPAVAAYLNENRLNPQMALEGYEQTVQEHLTQPDGSEGDKTYRVANLRNLSALLEELQPTIRHQFFDATLRQCENHVDNPLVEGLLSGMSQGLVLEMLRHANRQGNEISPTLLNLVQKIARIKESAVLGDQSVDSPASTQIDSSDPTQHQEILRLFDREAYENYVTSDYGEILKDLSRDVAPASDEMTKAADIGQYLESLESPHLDIQIARALMALMSHEVSVDEYRDYAGKIFQIANDLTGQGAFSVSLEILHTIHRHAEGKADPAVRSCARDYLDRFRHPAFVSKALAAFDKWRNEEKGTAQDFLMAIGPDIVPQALSLYVQRDQSKSDDHLFQLLALFSDRVTEIARTDLKTRRGASLLRLIRLVRRLGTQDLTSDLRALVDHHDRQVRMEVLETLVRFRDPESVDLLRKFFGVDHTEDVLRAIEIAGMYKVAELAQDLASMVKTFSLHREHYLRNEKIIEALARIAHPCAIPALERLARTRFSFYPEKLASLKLLLFQSLKLYEGKGTSIGPLLRIGARARDPRIRNACREHAQGTGVGSSDSPPNPDEVEDSDGSAAN